MSGTSLDGIDAVLLRIDADSMSVECGQSLPMPADLADLLRVTTLPEGRLSLADFGRINALLANAYATAVAAVLSRARVETDAVRAIGMHGQTLFHAPRALPPNTLQAGDGARLAVLTRLPVVCDFRSADVAAGGEGAPLAPLFHQACFGHLAPTGVLNIGGIANLTVIRESSVAGLSGFDTGPGNCLMDEWANRHRGTDYDEGGQWAASGELLQDLLSRLLDDRFFELAPPKSTGRDYFNLDWLRHRSDGECDSAKAADVQATLLELTVRPIARAAEYAGLTRIIVCGGGADNEMLMQRLCEHLPAVSLERSDVHGIDAGYVEAAAFGWLAHQRLEGLPAAVTTVTGAAENVALGAVHDPFGNLVP